MDRPYFRKLRLCSVMATWKWQSSSQSTCLYLSQGFEVPRWYLQEGKCNIRCIQLTSRSTDRTLLICREHRRLCCAWEWQRGETLDLSVRHRCIRPTPDIPMPSFSVSRQISSSLHGSHPFVTQKCRTWLCVMASLAPEWWSWVGRHSGLWAAPGQSHSEAGNNQNL